MIFDEDIRLYRRDDAARLASVARWLFGAFAGVVLVGAAAKEARSVLGLVLLGLSLAAIYWVLTHRDSRAKERELRETLDTVPNLAWVMDPGGSVLWVNARWTEFTGLEREALLGPTRWRGVLHPDDVEASTEAWEDAVRTGSTFEAEYRLRAADGEYRWQLARARPERDASGRILRWIGSCTNIDQKKKAEERLRVIADRFRHLALATAQVIWTTDPNGRANEDSVSWRAFSGQTREQAKNEGFWQHVHPDDLERAQTTWRRAILTQEMAQLEVRIRRADGEWIDTLVRGVPVFGPDGQLREWIGANTDISERKRAERKLLEENRRKDEFLAMLGHELRNPLAPILTSVSVLKQSDADTTQVGVIERQALHMSRLVDDLLDVSRISGGRVQLRRQPVELVEIVERAIESVRPMLEARRHRLSVQVPPRGLRVNGDLVRLSQVVSNLLNNAAKYTDPGGQVSLRAKRDGEQLVISVADNGIGIEPSLLPSVFDLFVQGSRSLGRETGGLGIGLTIVKRLVEMHEGKIRVHSDGHGKGSRFEVSLPALPAESAVAEPLRFPPRGRHAIPSARAARTAKKAARPARARSLHVLVVDDNLDAALTLETFLTNENMRVDVAHDGATAIKIAKRYPPNVVLLDIGLPGMDGYEVARRMRAEPVLEKTRILALTGYGQASDRDRAKSAGFDGHLVKPATGEKLLEELFSTEPCWAEVERTDTLDRSSG